MQRRKTTAAEIQRFRTLVSLGMSRAKAARMLGRDRTWADRWGKAEGIHTLPPRIHAAELDLAVERLRRTMYAVTLYGTRVR